jgi:membrane-anchored mycosin MYCP
VTYPVLASKDDMAAAADAKLGTGVRVGILDTRLYAHPDLAGSYLARPDDLLPTDGKTPFSHSAGHATFIAGLVRRQAPAAELAVRWTLSDADATASVWDVALRMLEFRALGVKILNLSLGCHTADGQPPMVIQRAVQLLSQEMVIVAAAGNYGDRQEDEERRPGVTPQSAFFPASLDDVIAVGADVSTGEGMKRAPFSPDLPWVTFATEGEAIVSTFVEGNVEIKDQVEEFGGYARWSGTSFAAGTVTGAIAALTEPGESAWPAVEKLRKLAGEGTGEVRIFTPGADSGQ